MKTLKHTFVVALFFHFLSTLLVLRFRFFLLLGPPRYIEYIYLLLNFDLFKNIWLMRCIYMLNNFQFLLISLGFGKSIKEGKYWTFILYIIYFQILGLWIVLYAFKKNPGCIFLWILNNYKNNLQDQNVQLVYLIINLEVVTRNSAIWYQITANVDFFDKYLLMCGYLTQRRYCYFLHYTGWKKIGFVQKKNSEVKSVIKQNVQIYFSSHNFTFQ